MKPFRFSVTSPDGTLFSDEIYQVSVRAVDGELAVLAGHIPMMTALVPAECRVYQTDGTMRCAQVGGGILSVTPEEVSLLSSEFSWKE